MPLTPLITDDTGTQGTGNWQLEVNTDHTRTRDEGQASWERTANLTLTRGVTDTLDLAVNAPWQHHREPGEPASSGVGDATVQAKWRFFDDGQGWTLGLRPALTLPTGNADRGLGNGRATASVTLISSLSRGDWTWLANAGYAYNDNRIGDRKNLWAASTAVLYNVDEQWTLALDVGARRAADVGQSVEKFALLGVIYRARENLDFDVGWRRSLGAAPVSHTLGAGVTWRW